ncbi:MAG: hypothetical protein II921_02645 [Treponema sp.]|nr:hypothetical protein [Treponema sp.]
MNTIPLYFNERQVNTTILGGKEKSPNIKMNVAAVVLNASWSDYRANIIDSLVICGFREIISVETAAENYNLEDFSRRYPFVKFVFPLEKCTDGDLINIAAAECDSDYFIVLRDSLKFATNLLTPTLFQQITEEKPFCVTPRLLGPKNLSFPIVFSPDVEKSLLKIEATSVVSDGESNLYPFDFLALYDRTKFIDLGGFDYTLTSSYWQNLDLAFRAWLWGEKIVLSTAFSLVYEKKIPEIDSSPCQASNRFYLKNLLPRFETDHAFIPASSFFVFSLRSSCGVFESVNQFREARLWTEKNKYRFKRDALYLVENWR